jgi:glucose-6-phosphate isomerase
MATSTHFVVRCAVGLKPVRPAFLRASRTAHRFSIQENPLTESAPVDPTSTDAWKALAGIADAFSPDLRGWFDADATRADRYTFQAADLTVDLSKGLITEEVLAQLLEVAKNADVAGRYQAMISGEHINATEDRAVLHTALRRPKNGTDLVPPAGFVVDGQDVDADVHATLDKVYTFAEKVRSGEWTGVTGKRIETVVNIGIGGSDLGPVMVYEALKPYVQAGIEVRFVSNIDPTDVYEKTAGLDPETTLFIVASKTFGTLETLTNARMARTWLWNELAAAGAIDDSDAAQKDAVAKHFVAVSTALDKVAAFGIDPENAFGFWDWVGGRYSVDSAIGTSIVIAIGPDNWREFLSGFHAIDEHMRTAPLEQNVPVLMGLLNVWYTNFLGAQSHAVLPYAQYLHRFPAYLQQLTMESNGKSVRWDGSPTTTDTGEIFWGEPGTNGQHAFYQLIHQGTRLVPADFIAVANPAHPIKDETGDGSTVEPGQDVHALFMANFFAQTKALAFGKTADEVRAEGTKESVVPAREFSGNRPTTSILAPSLTPSVVGQLIALYEHIVFVEGTIWGIDSFDQWGVELGKQLALQVAPAVDGDTEALESQDASTKALIKKYLELRK